MDKTSDSERQVVTALLSCLFVPGVCLPLPSFPLPVVGVKYEARYRDISLPFCNACLYLVSAYRCHLFHFLLLESSMKHDIETFPCPSVMPVCTWCLLTVAIFFHFLLLESSMKHDIETTLTTISRQFRSGSQVAALMEIIPSMSMVGALQFEPLGFQICMVW